MRVARDRTFDQCVLHQKLLRSVRYSRDVHECARAIACVFLHIVLKIFSLPQNANAPRLCKARVLLAGNWGFTDMCQAETKSKSTQAVMCYAWTFCMPCTNTLASASPTARINFQEACTMTFFTYVYAIRGRIYAYDLLMTWEFESALVACSGIACKDLTFAYSRVTPCGRSCAIHTPLPGLHV